MIDLDVSAETLCDIALHIGAGHAERGGLLLGKTGSPAEQISWYLADERSECSSVTYSPDVRWVGEVVSTPGVVLRGFVHSHPRGYRTPSPGDLRYVEEWFRVNPSLGCFHLPIIDRVPFRRKLLRKAERGEGLAEIAQSISWYVILRESPEEWFRCNIGGVRA